MTEGTWQLNFDSAPFCNGSLHLGHVRCYVQGDVSARWLRASGLTVRYATAYDAFGLPHEAGADAAGVPTHRYVADQIDRIAGQLKRLGLSYDRTDHPRTCDPRYYRWTQWLFLALWKAGLVYRAQRDMPYCHGCREFLAATQIEQGRCWRCGARAGIQESRQWFIRTTQYATELWNGIDSLTGWSPRARTMMRSFLARKQGRLCLLEVPFEGTTHTVRLFAEQGVQAASIGLWAGHPLIRALGTPQAATTRSRRGQGGFNTDPVALLHLGHQKLVVFPMAAHDLPADVDARFLSQSGDPSELPTLHGSESGGHATTVFGVGDWLVSRSREWATPLPAVECPRCGVQPVPEEALPVRLPCHGGDGGSVCGRCGGKAPTVPDKLDCFLDDTWCFHAAHPRWSPDINPFTLWSSDPAQEVFFHSGFDSFVYVYLYRFLGHALRDMGLLEHPEILTRFEGHDVVKSGGRKMAKRHGNAADLDRLLDEHGADVVRLAVLAGANPDKPLEWSEDALHRAHRLVREAERLFAARPDPEGPTLPSVSARLAEMDRFMGTYRFATALQSLYLATRDWNRRGGTPNEHRLLCAAWQLFLRGQGLLAAKAHSSAPALA
ncbi:MAG: class I tRNA ligase family protein [Rhodothermales bacterium]|nr:class I tRNA ligase family protein [Rhodothermales bacterium]MBO6779430.1 class I tRNA ligase family protein [Rhodothermales bacterium]